jgi:hypothetical protein
MMTDYLKRELKLAVEVSTTTWDRKGQRTPQRVRFHLVGRWIDIPGELVAVQQGRHDAPTLHTHTIFGSKEDAPLYADSEAAVLAAVREYLRQGLSIFDAMEDE